MAIFDSSTIDGSPSTVTFHPRPVGQSGACSSPSQVRIHLALRHVQHAVGIQRDDLVDVLGGPHADRPDAAHVTDVTARLVVAINQRADQLEVGMSMDGGNGMLAHRSDGPLDDSQHQVIIL
ncbi:hypothetical protein MSAR_22350 [Mycolicibacterium sarraceniae]|uniref:Uncharacterized protein n=1 Tax=Mycolicibacterium sarraceniae TaxID=1534348 RepID=A0A7I7SSH8_9MYCO|nr:hypothetical protein MSAR_22350 [Mycolicibacterium sarraceniae]